MKKIAIITGLAGQDGAYLADFLLKKNYCVIGLVLSLNKEYLRGLDFFGIKKKVTLVRGDVNSSRTIKKLLLKYNPQEFYNLAGQSSVAKSWEDSTSTFKVNGLAVIQMLELIKNWSPKTRFFECSSAEIFGNTKRIITEDNLNFNPLNPYGSSKLIAHLAVKIFREQYNLFACNGILFNHESPLKADFTASKKITKGVAMISLGLLKKIELGDILVKRDWGYAEDFVKAMWLVLQQKKPQDFIICTGKSYPLWRFVDEAFKCAGIKEWRKHIVVNKRFFRKNEVKVMLGSSAKIRKLGWHPQTDLKRLVKLMVNYELAKFKK